MRRAALFPALAGLALALAAALPARAEGGPPAADVEALVQAIRAAGCALTAENQDQVLAAAGLTLPQAEVIVSKLVEDGRAELADADVHLTDADCR
jgi:hypothetical protein